MDNVIWKLIGQMKHRVLKNFCETTLVVLTTEFHNHTMIVNWIFIREVPIKLYVILKEF